MPGLSKLLRPWNGGMLVEAAVSVAREVGLQPCIVVVGSSAESLVPGLARHEVIAIEHGAWSRGRASSLAAGLESLRGFDAVQAVVVLLGDEPGVRPEAIRAVTDEWRKGAPDLVRVRYRDRPGHPVLLGRTARELALDLDGEESVWDRLIAAGLAGVEVPVDLESPVDVDVPAALQEARVREKTELTRSGDPGVSE